MGNHDAKALVFAIVLVSLIHRQALPDSGYRATHQIRRRLRLRGNAP